MREILFRGKRVDNGEWIEGSFVKMDDIRCMIVTHSSGGAVSFGNQVDPKTVGQFTGLTDKNGKKIFEGDILQGTIVSRWAKNVIRCEVVYSNDGFISVNRTRNSDWVHKVRFAKDVKVIGNIHDNPELLEVCV